jgi:hypothetical protein
MCRSALSRRSTPPTVTAEEVPRYDPVIVIAVPPRKHPSVGVMPLIDAGHGPQLASNAPRSPPLITPSPLISDATDTGFAGTSGPHQESCVPRSPPLTTPSLLMSPVHCADAGTATARLRMAIMARRKCFVFMVGCLGIRTGHQRPGLCPLRVLRMGGKSHNSVWATSHIGEVDTGG